ncbi:glucosylceramide transporter ABCA12 [Spea bombifrons]|uniref:glucosylceramide transporter ABCA12 n=1 Tax=Spea bombifrons TaxID=233779 RepID=UPI00234AFCAE|nr:glucosylceramide transporter ABCA12 [Spea bombifrons]
MHNRLSIISTVAAQWLSTINVNVSASQQLIHLYNATLLMYQHQPILHAINTSAVNIIQMLQESGNLLNVTVNGADAAVNLLAVILQAGDFEATKYNISDVLTYNISDLLESIRLQLDVVQWAMLQVANKTALLESNPGAYVMHTITQWILKNYPYINAIMQDTQSVINSFNGSFNLTSLIHLINSTVHIEQVQLLINQAAAAMKNSSNVSFPVNLILNENIQDDTELALQILQEFNHINLSMTLSSIDKALHVLQRLLTIDLGPLHQFNNNATLVKIYNIVKEGMSILNNIQEKGSINKEMVYRMYNFTYLLVQDEWNWTPFQNISAMEAELLDVWFLAMSPFLGGTESQEYIGNCSAQDVLNILVETIFHDATGNESIWEGNCLWRFVYNSSDPNLQNNYTLNEMIYLALQSSPVFHNISTEGSLHPLAGEMACLLQLMEISVIALASLNNASGLNIPVIRSLNDSLAFICDGVTEHNTTFHEEVHLVHLLDQILLNRSNSIQLFMLFFVEMADLNIQTLDLQSDLAEVSSIVKTLATLNGQDRVLELIEKVLNITHQPYFLQSWNALDSFLFMNWTASEINDSISNLEKLRKVITILVNSGMEAKPIQIYQAIVSLLKTQNTTLLNMGSPSEMNASSVIQCGVVLSAAFRFSDSLWVALDPQHSSLNQQFLSNISSLVCNLVNVRSLNYTWNSDLEMIIHALQYVANVIPSEVSNYFTAAEKILSLLFGLPSSMNSTEDMVMVVFELLIEELRIFNRTNTIASWLEVIPLRSIYLLLKDISSDFKATAPEHQTTITESNISNVLLEALNATSYPQALSSSSTLTLVPSSVSGLTNITQHLLSLTLHNVLLPEPYSTVLHCLKNATQVLAASPSGHLEGIIQLIQDVFTQSNKSANASMIPHLLKEKIYQLQTLKTLVCGLSGTNSTQSCFMVCQDNALLQSILDLVVTSIEGLATIVDTSSSLTMKTVLETISKFPQEVLSSIIPLEDLQNVTLTLSTFINVSSTSKQATVQDVFHNSSRVRNQLSRVVKLSPGSIEALMMLPIDEVKKQVISWFTDADNSTTNFSTIDKLLPAQGYQMAIIFLQNVDIYNLLYRLIVPATWQGNIDLIVALLKNMTDMITPFPQERINQIIQILNFLFPQNTVMSRTTKASTASFMDISRALCNGNYQSLVAALSSLYPTLRMTSQVKAPSIKDTFGIPGDNKFCLELLSSLVNTTSGANYWIVLKPMLYGQILYTPKTVETEEIMQKTNRTLQEIWGVKNDVAYMTTVTKNMLTMWPLLQNVKILKDIFDNQFVRTLLEKSLDLNITDIAVKLNQTANLVDSVRPYVKYFELFTKIADVLSNLLSCVGYNRIHPMNNSTEMEQKAKQLQETNDLFAAVTFDLPVGSTRQRRSVSGKQPLPKKIKYSITMRSLLSEDTTFIRDDYWIPGPHNLGNKYSRGFVYLQENIERAIVEMQTNKSLDDLVARFQPMPYPCYKKDQFLAGIFFSFPVALMIAWVLFIAFFVKKLVHDKEMRLHEYMKMMGVNSCSHFFAWFIESAIFLIITVAILVLILKFGQILPNSNGFILFLFFLDYSMTVIAMSYLISVFFHNTSVAALSGSLIYIITFFPFIVIASKEKQLSFAAKTLLSIFSPTALSYGNQFIVNYEQQNIGIQWHNLYHSPVINDSFSCGWICWVMLIDSLIYFIVGAYIRTVFPGKYGIGAPWYFPVLPSYWSECCGFSSACSKKPSGMMFTNLMAQEDSHKKDAENNLSQNYEPEPTGLNVGVSLHGLTKIYQSKAAVQNLNLTFYEGHITALLGHNGAGKTTTLSMLTGLFSATSGTIFVYGEDIRTHLDKARRSMGVCMQYDVLFDYLTTREHLLLYGSIKAPQWNKSQLHEEVERTLKDTGLYRHSHKPVKALSGGMRRKLSICIAMIGGSKVVILDEPTTGVDPCSRRSIWEVISRNKMDKTIILSTHHLDEAEVLSDRIAFLEQGGLKCCGSPMFLKDRFGSGYHLTLTKKYPTQETDGQCNSEEVTALIQSHIPEARLKEDVGGELIYILPPFKTEISNAYLSLLRALDTSLNDLNIGYYGISDTTIEEVFLNLTDGVADDEQDNAPLPSTPEVIPITKRDNNLVNDESSSTSYSFQDRDDQALTGREKIKGVKLTFKKIMAIFIKRFHHSKRDWKGAISQILLPVLFVIAAMGLGSLSNGDANYPELLLSPNLYGTTEQAVVFGSNNARTDNLISAMLSPPGIDNMCLDNNVQCLKEDSLGFWNSTGDQQQPYGTCNCSTSSAVCGVPDATPPHRRTYSRQMLYNITGHKIEKYLLTTTLQYIQKRYGGWSFGDTVQKDSLAEIFDSTANKITTTVWYNPEGPHSLPAFLNSFNNFLLRANLPSNESDQYGIFVSNKPLPGSVPLATTSITLVNSLVALSILAGYSITTASFATYVVKEHHNGSKRLQHIAGVGEVIYWLTNFFYDLILYFIPVALSIAMIAAFQLPAFYNYPNLGAVSLLFILFGYATFAWMYLVAGAFKNPGMAFIVYVGINLFIGINSIISTSIVYLLTQQTGTSNANYQSLNQTYNALMNAFKIFPQFCFGYGLIQLSQEQAIQNQLSLYGNTEKNDIFKMDILGWMLAAMAIEGTFFLALRLLINEGIIFSIKSFFKKTCLKGYDIVARNLDEDEDVKTERERVESHRAEGDLLQLQGLTKVFYQVNKKTIAVNNMSLGIPPGECFGLLGVNGAGKTTTFKMLTGDIIPSKGNIQVRDQTGNLVNVLGFNTDWSAFGYCPQEDALDELMTGEEHLYYYARIHGIPDEKIKSACHKLLCKLHLLQYKDRITANYSCGTRRKLSTALALIGRPSILLLDEPSSGMDPKTKRHLWKIISEEVKDRCAVVLTSHSMEECEALCTRLAIMVRGKFQCIGSLQHIKSRFGSGFTVKMHLKDSSVDVETITSFMHFHFPNTYLKDKHFAMVEYHVPVSAGGVAGIFEVMEPSKANLNVIHFSVSQTTLDEVFINFAQSQASPDNSSADSQEFDQVVVT